MKDEHAIKSDSTREMVEMDSAIDLLLTRLTIPVEELRDPTVNQPSVIAKALLRYYKNRQGILHLIDRTKKGEAARETAQENDQQVADDALQHIFLGQPAYPRHFCGEDINWKTNPVPDKEWLWQLHRMYFWNAMGRVYATTKEEKYAKSWCNQLLDWTRKNPNDALHAYAWRSIEAGIRGYSWTGLFQYFIDSPNFTDAVLVAFLNSCYDHAEHLMQHYRTGSNWALMEAEGLAFIAITFPEFHDSKKWLGESISRLNREIKKQVYPDGHQRELAMGYHIGCINWFLRSWQLAKINQIDTLFSDQYLSTIEKMCEVPMKIGLPDGTNAQFGDAWAGVPGQHQKRFTQWAKLFDRSDFLYLASGGEMGQPPASTTYALPASGIYSMRSDWTTKAVCLILKCGLDGGGHCQPDNGTFTLFAGGRNLMPDAGSYIYSGDPEQRAWFRQTAVHQTLTLNGQNSNYAPQLKLWNPGNDRDILVVENQNYPELAHRRAVIFVDKQYFILIDEAHGKAEGQLDLHFQLAPGPAKMDIDQYMVCSDFAEGWNIQIKTNPQPGLILEKEEGQVSFVYTKKQDRPAFRFRKIKTRSEQTVRFITTLIPTNGREFSDLQIELHSAPWSEQVDLRIAHQDQVKLISYNLK